MYRVAADEGSRLNWGRILFISSAMLLISLVVWWEMPSISDPDWQLTTYWEQQVNHLTPHSALGMQVCLVLLVLRGRIRGSSNRSLQRLLGLLVVTVIVLPLGYVIWSTMVLSRFAS